MIRCNGYLNGVYSELLKVLYPEFGSLDHKRRTNGGGDHKDYTRQNEFLQ